MALMDEPELFGPSEFDINRSWENFKQELYDDAARAAVDRSQFGLEQTQPLDAQDATTRPGRVCGAPRHRKSGSGSFALDIAPFPKTALPE